MEQIVLLAIQAVEALLPSLASVSSGGVAKIIALLEQAIPVAQEVGEDLLTPIMNIIAALQSNANVTPAQVQALDVQMTAAEAQLDADAKADGLTGVDGTTGQTGATGS